MDGLIVDSFAGGGGASLGIAWALGRCPDIAINHDPSAIAMHAANHPSTEHVLEDVWKADLKKLVGNRRVGLLWLSPDCFPAGTLIITDQGMKPIEEIEVGDRVLTHKNRWRPVLSLMNKEAETVTVRGHGHYGLVTTPSHPFYSKRIRTGDDRLPFSFLVLGYRFRKVENPYWPEAANMEGKLWATPRAFPESEIPTTRIAFSKSFFYWVGRWIGDGSLNKGDLEISCGLDEFESFARFMDENPLLNSDGSPIPYRTNKQGSTVRVIWGCQALANWCLSNFNAYSHAKQLPNWVYSMQREWRQALLDGYIDSDGCQDAINVIGTTSVSKSLTIGFRLLAATLGHAAAMYFVKGNPGTIEGRSFQARDAYRLRWRENLQTETVFWDCNHLFTPVRKVTPSGVRRVFSLEVDEDESYVADGIVVHNCKHFSRAKGGKPVEKKIRSLAWIACKWAAEVGPHLIVLENVREFADWGPLVPRLTCKNCGWKGTTGQAILMRKNHKCPQCDSKRLRKTDELVPCPDRKGATFKRFVSRLRNLGYDVEYRNLDAADYGAPTHRKRLFLIARNDGQPISWPEATHCHPDKLLDRLQPYRTAAECIDWSIECPSIFDRKKPLAEKTMRRIALGIRRYVIDNPEPFIVPIGYGERKGQTPRTESVKDPLGTIVGSQKHAVVTPIVSRYNGSKTSFLVKYFGTAIGASLTEPAPTATGKDRFGLVTVQVNGEPYVIVDIGMRMLTPRELARAQGFPDTYVLTGTKTSQVARIGNSVCPHVAAALLKANCGSFVKAGS